MGTEVCTTQDKVKPETARVYIKPKGAHWECTGNLKCYDDEIFIIQVSEIWKVIMP